MSENKDREFSSSNNENEKPIRTFEKSMDKMDSEQTKSTTGTVSGGAFQQVLVKFQQVQTNEKVNQNRFRQQISLFNELIDNVEKATSDDDDDDDDFQKCLKLFRETQHNCESDGKQLLSCEVFFALLDLLSKPQICMYLNDNEQLMPINKKYYGRLTNLFLFVIKKYVRNMSFTNKDAAITHKYLDIFRVLGKRLDHDLQIRLEIDQPIPFVEKRREFILSFLANLSDLTIVVPWLLGIGLTDIVLNNLKTTDIPTARRLLIIIIQNISRHDDGAVELKKLDGLAILKDIQSKDSEKVNNKTNLVISMAIAQLSTPEQIRSDNKRKNRMLNELLQYTIGSSKGENHRSNSFHVSELLAVLTKLFVDDQSLDYVLNHAETDPQLTLTSTIALFVDLLIEFRGDSVSRDPFKQFTCIALLNILWSISFQDRYKTKLQQNNELMEIIKSLAMDTDEQVIDQHVPSSMDSMAKASSGILYNLDQISNGNDHIIEDTHLISNANNEKPVVMISYAHDNNPFCDKILAEFEKNQKLFGIWIDRDHCSSSKDLWEEIARGIKQSTLVVCLLSQEYFNSKSCRKEMNLAIHRQKFIVPVYIGQPGDCDWLDIHIAGLKYVRFKDHQDQLDPNKIDELLKTIQATIREAHAQQPPERHEQHTIPVQARKEPEIEKSIASEAKKPPEIQKSITSEAKKPPEEWTADDIQKWLRSYHVPDMLIKLFDFQSTTEMYRYASKLRANSNEEFMKYQQRYAKNYPGEVLEEYIFDRFKNALLNLPKSQLEPTNAPTSPSEISKTTSNTCILL